MSKLIGKLMKRLPGQNEGLSRQLEVRPPEGL